MNESYIKNVIEAALLAAGRPLTVAEIGELFDELGRPSAGAIRDALTSLEQDYTERGIEVKETATGFRIQVRRNLANEISRLWPERPPRYSRALLETLALVAYRQPITRAEIEAVRGVAVNPNIIKTIIERNWVRVVGHRDVPGRPELLGTTKDFLDYFGLRSLDELPPLAELKAMGDVNLQLDLAKESGISDAPALVAATSEAANDVAPSDTVADDAVATNSDASEVADEANAVSADSGNAVVADASDDAEAEEEEAPAVAHDVELTALADAVAAEPVELQDGAQAERAEHAEIERGPKARAAEAFLAEIEEDADASSLDDDASDDDELSAADRDDSGELVAAPPRYDD